MMTVKTLKLKIHGLWLKMNLEDLQLYMFDDSTQNKKNKNSTKKEQKEIEIIWRKEINLFIQ